MKYQLLSQNFPRLHHAQITYDVAEMNETYDIDISFLFSRHFHEYLPLADLLPRHLCSSCCAFTLCNFYWVLSPSSLLPRYLPHTTNIPSSKAYHMLAHVRLHVFIVISDDELTPPSISQYYHLDDIFRYLHRELLSLWIKRCSTCKEMHSIAPACMYINDVECTYCKYHLSTLSRTAFRRLFPEFRPNIKMVPDFPDSSIYYTSKIR